MAVPVLCGRSWRQWRGTSAASPAGGGGCRRGSRSRRSGRGRILPDHGRGYLCHGPARFVPRRAGHRCGCAVRAPGVPLPGGRIRHPDRSIIVVTSVGPLLSVSPFGRSRLPPCRWFALLADSGRACVLSRRAAFPGGTVGAGPAGRSRPGPGPRRGDRLRRPPGPLGSGWCRSPRWGVSEPAAVSGWEVRGDERVELGLQQPGIRADQLGEHRVQVSGRADGVVGCFTGECGVIVHVAHLPGSRFPGIRFRR